MLILVIGIGVVDCAVTAYAGLRLKGAAEKQIKAGVDQLMEIAPALIVTAIENISRENNG